MAAIPPAAFESRLRGLDHDEFVAFVTALWEATGWQATGGEHVVEVRNGPGTERLLVVGPSRFTRFRTASAGDDDIDRVVSPRRVDDRTQLPRKTPDVPVVDAEQLRRRLLYAVPADEGDGLCRQTLGVPLRDDRWTQTTPSDDGRWFDPNSVITRRTALEVAGVGLFGAGAVWTQVDTGESPTAGGLDEAPQEPRLPPETNFEFEFEESLLTIRHAGGDSILAGNLVFRGQGFAGAPYRKVSETARYGPEDEITEGDTLRVRSSTDSRLRVLWEEDGTTKTLGTYEATAPQGAFSLTVTMDGPAVTFADSYTNGQLVLRHTGGDQLSADSLLIRGDGFDGAPSVWWSERDSAATVSRGDEVVFTAADSYTVQVLAVDDDSGALVDQFYGPGRPLEPTLGGLQSYGYDTGNTGHAATQRGPVDEATALWTFDTGASVGSSPAVVGGIVYVGNFDGRVSALDAADGDELWRFEAADRIGLSSPSVWDGTVYVGDESGTLYALDARTGRLDWQFEGVGNVTTSPTLVADQQPPTLYVTSFGQGEPSLFALDATDGTTRWATGESDLNTTPAVADGTVVVGGRNGVSAFDTSDGANQWQVDTGEFNPVNAAPAVTDGTVYVGARDGTVLSLSLADGSQQWSSTVYGQLQTTPTVAPVARGQRIDPIVLVGSTENDTFIALDGTDGTEQWRFTARNTVAGKATVVGRPSAPSGSQQMAYLPSFDGRLYAVDPADGTLNWSYHTDGQVSGSPAVVDGVVYIGSGDGRVYALTNPSHPLFDPYWTQQEKS